MFYGLFNYIMIDYFLIKIGFTANQIKAGKKCKVIARNGKYIVISSLKSRGNLYPIGPRILAKVKIVNKKLKIISPYFGEIFVNPQKPIEANIQANIQAPIKFEACKTGEKSTNVISL